MASSLNVGKILNVIKEARGTGELPRLCVVGAGEAQRRVVEYLGQGVSRLASGAPMFFDALELSDLTPQVRTFDPYDIVVFVAAGSEPRHVAPYAAAARRGGRRVLALVEGKESRSWLVEAGFNNDEAARSLGRTRGVKPSLERQIVDAADHSGSALAARLPVLRREYAEKVIMQNAKQNGVIGAVFIIPGADMPAMTANQIRMVLQIAAGYGEEIGVDRAFEILSVVGGAFAFRALARQVLDFVPGFGWVLKGAIGFTGTVALGRAAVSYFEAGAPIQVSRVKALDAQIDKVRSRIPDSIQRRLSGR